MRDLFEKGVSFRSFVMNMDADIKTKIMKYYIPLDIKDEYRKKLDAIDKSVRILGVVEGWCPDCQINLPILEKLISANKNVDMRLVLREDVGDTLSTYAVDGKIKVPTFIFMDEDYNIFGTFIEKPESVRLADLDTVEGSKTVMMYKAFKLVDETVEELLQILTEMI